MNNNKITISSNNLKAEDKRIFSNVYLISFVMFISLIFIGYAIYYKFYLSTKFMIKENSSFYGKDLLNYQPLFGVSSKNIEDCIDICNKDIICEGITYNNNSKFCVGTKNGELRNESGDFSAWVKPTEIIKTPTNFKNSILIGYTDNNKMILKEKIIDPFTIGNFAYSFNIIIKDFYKNYGYWRHIFHKGTHIEPSSLLNYQSWETLSKEIPNQSIGVWMAPFTNNLRIAITTTTLSNLTAYKYDHAYIQNCNDDGECYITDLPSGKWSDKRIIKHKNSFSKPKIDKLIEFIDHDLQNIPINTKINNTINIYNKNVEIYFNGRIVKISQLEGTPIRDKNNLYVFNDYSINGEISNLLFYPEPLKLSEIKDILELEPST